MDSTSDTVRQCIAETITTLIMEQITEAEAHTLLADQEKLSLMVKQLCDEVRATGHVAPHIKKDLGTFTFRLCGVRLEWPLRKNDV